MTDDVILDTRGLRCPLPVLKLRKRLSDLPTGQVISVVADDPVAMVDIPHFVAESGHSLLEQTVSGQEQRYRIAKV